MPSFGGHEGPRKPDHVFRDLQMRDEDGDGDGDRDGDGQRVLLTR